MIGRYTRLGVEAFSNHNLDAGHMINCLNNHVEEVVVKGWFQLFKVIEALCGLLFSVLVVMYLTFDSEAGRFEWRVAVPIVPSIAMALYATQSREAENIRLAKDRERKEDSWISLANEVSFLGFHFLSVSSVVSGSSLNAGRT